MVALKSHEVDRALSRPSHKIILLYGPDSGLVSERADKLAKTSGVKPDDPFLTIRLDADEAAHDKGRLVDEASTIAMFGEQRLIRLSGQTRRNLVDAIKPLLEITIENCWVIIEAGDLDKRSALRLAFEKSPNGLALPCYPDNDRDLDRLIDEEINAKGLSISAQTKAFLKPFLGANRRASRNELEKLTLYAADQGEITIEHIRAIVGDASLISIDDLIDMVITGQLSQFEEYFARLINETMSADMMLLSALRRFQLLHELASNLASNGGNAASLVKSVRPMIHFSRHDAMITALRVWPATAFFRATKRLSSAMFEARRAADLAHSLAGTAFLALTIEASHHMKKN